MKIEKKKNQKKPLVPNQPGLQKIGSLFNNNQKGICCQS